MSLRDDLAAVVDRVRRNGLREAFSRSWTVLKERLVQPWEHVCWLPAAEVARLPAPPDVRLRVLHATNELSDDDRAQLRRSLGDDAYRLLEERVGRGCELHLLDVGDRIAGSRFVVWGATHPFQNVVLTPRDTMGMDVRIDRDFRGRGLAPVFFSLSIQDLARRGCERVFATVAVHNTPSIRTLDRVGFRRLLDVRVERGRYRYDRAVID